MQDQSKHSFAALSDNGLDLAAARAKLTFQEREILAIERISDQIAGLREMMGKCDRSTRSRSENAEKSEVSVSDWESEGGSLEPQHISMQGIDTETVSIFHVGPYTYTDLDLAKAELARQRSGRAGRGDIAGAE